MLQAFQTCQASAAPSSRWLRHSQALTWPGLVVRAWPGQASLAPGQRLAVAVLPERQQDAAQRLVQVVQLWAGSLAASQLEVPVEQAAVVPQAWPEPQLAPAPLSSFPSDEPVEAASVHRRPRRHLPPSYPAQRHQDEPHHLAVPKLAGCDSCCRRCLPSRSWVAQDSARPSLFPSVFDGFRCQPGRDCLCVCFVTVPRLEGLLGMRFTKPLRMVRFCNSAAARNRN